MYFQVTKNNIFNYKYMSLNLPWKISICSLKSESYGIINPLSKVFSQQTPSYTRGPCGPGLLACAMAPFYYFSSCSKILKEGIICNYFHTYQSKLLFWVLKNPCLIETVLLSTHNVCLFVWFDSLRPSQQSFSYVGMGLPRLNQY